MIGNLRRRIHPEEVSQVSREAVAVFGKCCIRSRKHRRAVQLVQLVGKTGKEAAHPFAIRETDGVVLAQESIFLEMGNLLAERIGKQILPPISKLVQQLGKVSKEAETVTPIMDTL